MIVSDKYKFIFIRVPKTATTSIERALLTIDPSCKILSDSEYESPPYGHYTGEQIKNHIGVDKWDSYFKFASVREPISRFMSIYSDMSEYRFNGPDFTYLQWFLPNTNGYGYGLPNYIDGNSEVSVDDVIMSYMMTKFWFLPSGLYKQLDWFDYEEIDYLIDYKTLESDWEYVQNKLGFESELGHFNKSNSNKSSVTLSADALELVKIIFKDDFEFYKNKKEG